MKLFAVTGNPVLFSKSLQLHRKAFSEQQLQDRYYTRLSAESFDEAVRIARQMNISGLNVTAPFKDDAFKSVTTVSESAAALEAVNTCIFNEDGTSGGHNTDPDGVLFALRNIPATVKKAVILGNGGAARAAAVALKKKGIGFSFLARNQKGDEATVLLDTEKAGELLAAADLVISTLPASAKLLVDDLLRHGFRVSTTGSERFFLDAVYGQKTDFLKVAETSGMTIIPGIHWLTGQGQRAFELLNGTVAESCRMDLTTNEKQSARKKVYLIGMMGSGKSSVLRELSKKGYDTQDTDSEIEARTGKSVSSIFAENDEPYFRTLEHEVLSSVDAAFIACGGGVITYEPNQKILSEGIVIWLWSPLHLLETRLTSSYSTRPLLDSSDLGSRLQTLLDNRFGRYAAAADLVISTEFHSPSKVAERIINEISSTL